jgi:hypothetical protein
MTLKTLLIILTLCSTLMIVRSGDGIHKYKITYAIGSQTARSIIIEVEATQSSHDAERQFHDLIPDARLLSNIEIK